MSQRTVSKNALMADIGDFADLLTSVNGFVDVGVLDCMLMKTKHFVFVGAANTLSVKILGSIDNGVTYPFEVEAAFDVAAAATVTKTVTTFYSNLKVQVQPKVAGVHGTLSTNYGMATF